MMSIALATAKGRHIANSQSGELPTIAAAALEGLLERHHAQRRGGCSVRYNCHGLTFASRRTGIDDSECVRIILEDDEYEEVAPAAVLPGDVALYFHPETGDIEHSGVVIEGLDAKDTLKPVRIVSKWSKGPEAIHNVNRCPYDPSAIRYFRIRKLV